MIAPEHLYATPNALATHYSQFRVDERLLLTGHSHQAWPDRGFGGQQQAWLDAADLVDRKWERATAMADRVRRGYARLLDDGEGLIALAPSTHDLVVRFLSALPLATRPRIVTTDGEFHTIRRQLDRLAEEGLEVVKVPDQPAGAIAQQLIDTVNDKTAAVLVSAVLFSNAQIVPELGSVLEACRRVGAELLVDAYHAINVVPFSVPRDGLDDAFIIVGGGYKYCQLGEGNCFLRMPADRHMRPVITGWFAEFAELASDAPAEEVTYGPGAQRFAGSTYDPTSHYRAAAVMDFFEEMDLTPALLHEVSQHQVGTLASAFDALDADPDVIARDRSVPLEAIGGFLALRAPNAGMLCRGLEEAGVYCDSRGDLLRLGPAPYLSDQQLTDAMERLGRLLTQAVPS